MRKIICLYFMFISSLLCAQNILRFFPKESFETRNAEAFTFAPLPEIENKEVSIDEHNECVELNNQAIEAMHQQNYQMAEKLFEKASRIMPNEKMFWNNRLVALNNIKGMEREAVNVGRVMMVFEPNNFIYPYNIGIVYLNKLKDYKQATAYLRYAHAQEPDNVDILRALTSALQNISGCEGDLFALLKENAHKDQSGYLNYLLGMMYLDRKDFNPAIRALDSARLRDDKGHAHYAWLRARFCSGQLDGLAKECKRIIKRFPDSPNAASGRRFLRSLTKQTYRFEEYINIGLKNASKIDEMDIYYKDIPNIDNHQEVTIISAEAIANGKVYKLSVEPTKKFGVSKIKLSKDAISPNLKVKIINKISVKPTIDACYRGSTDEYDVSAYRDDKLLCLHNPSLNALYNRLKRQEGGFVLNAVLAVVRGLEYRENGIEHNVDWIFQNPTMCDCSEFSLLMSALSIKNKMPSRLVHGFLVKSDNLNKETQIGHAWCEIYSKGNGWVPVDATASKGVDWAYCGHLLSDQIVFGYKNGEKDESRVTLSYTALKYADVDIEMSASYKISIWSN